MLRLASVRFNRNHYFYQFYLPNTERAQYAVRIRRVFLCTRAYGGRQALRSVRWKPLTQRDWFPPPLSGPRTVSTLPYASQAHLLAVYIHYLKTLFPCSSSFCGKLLYAHLTLIIYNI